MPVRASMFRRAGAPDGQPPPLIPKAPDAAAITVFAPERRIDMCLSVERGYEFVAVRR